MTNKPHINPRFRAFGKARIDIAQRVKTQEDWDTLWKDANYTFPFSWSGGWKQCLEYRVDDYAAEVGFYIDVLGLAVDQFGGDYARFSGPDGEFFIAVAPAPQGEPATPSGAFRLQFAIRRLSATVTELERRGIVFDQKPQPAQEGAALSISSFHTPHGIPIDLIGEEERKERARGRRPEDAMF